MAATATGFTQFLLGRFDPECQLLSGAEGFVGHDEVKLFGSVRSILFAGAL
ncbi:hypothetical protein ACFS07_03375 [Undibacterium arcticum]